MTVEDESTKNLEQRLEGLKKGNKLMVYIGAGLFALSVASAGVSHYHKSQTNDFEVKVCYMADKPLRTGTEEIDAHIDEVEENYEEHCGSDFMQERVEEFGKHYVYKNASMMWAKRFLYTALFAAAAFGLGLYRRRKVERALESLEK